MAIKTRDELIASLAASQQIGFMKTGVATQVAGRYLSLFRVAGRPGATDLTTPSVTGVALGNATEGSLPYVDAPAGKQSYLCQAGMSSNSAGSLVVYDRMVETGGLSGTVTTAQTVGSVPLPARGAARERGVALWLECYVTMGATLVPEASTSISYTNELGVAGRIGRVIGGIPATLRNGQMIPCSLQAGDLGVRSVESVTLSVSTGTAGNFGFVLMRRIAEVPVIANTAVVLGYADLGLNDIDLDSCVTFMVLNSTTTSPTLVGSLQIAQG